MFSCVEIVRSVDRIVQRAESTDKKDEVIKHEKRVKKLSRKHPSTLLRAGERMKTRKRDFNRSNP
jgi:predicted GIY-YIG superfamily endonuclease